jgi:hypothetical protein
MASLGRGMPNSSPIAGSIIGSAVKSLEKLTSITDRKGAHEYSQVGVGEDSNSLQGDDNENVHGGSNDGSNYGGNDTPGSQQASAASPTDHSSSLKISREKSRSNSSSKKVSKPSASPQPVGAGLMDEIRAKSPGGMSKQQSTPAASTVGVGGVGSVGTTLGSGSLVSGGTIDVF